MAFMETMQMKMESSLVPFAAKVNGQRHVAALRDAFTLAFPLTLAGSLVTLVNNAVLSPSGFIAQLLHLGDLIPNLADYQVILSPVLNGTANLMSVLIAFLTAYKLSETLKGDKILAAITAVAAFFIMYPPYAALEDGTVVLKTGFLGAQGLFVAIIVGLVVGESLTRMARSERLRIHMPDAVPPAVSQSFNNLLPIVLCMAGAAVVNYLFGLINADGIQMVIYTAIQAPFAAMSGNIVTILVFSLVQQFLWVLGIHGPNTLSALRAVMFAEPAVANLSYFGQMGTTVGTPFPVTWSINDAFANAGGSGATLGLLIAIYLVGRRDKRQFEIAKLATAPGLFNINEPLMFGLPIVMNPIYCIPFLLTPFVLNVMGFVCTNVINVIPPIGVDVGWTTPGFLIPFLGSGGTNWLSLVIGILCVAIATLMYLPFVRVAAAANMRAEQEAKQAA